MNKVFKLFGLIILLITYNINTNKVQTVSKNIDEVYKKLKIINDKEKISPVETIIKNDTQIIGKKGKKIDIEKSYKKIKEYNNFSKKNIIYKQTFPKQLPQNNLDKYIIAANEKDREIIMIFTNEKTESKTIKKILDYNHQNEYCITNKPDKNLMKNCIRKNKNTILSELIEKNPYIYTKTNLNNGHIFYYKINYQLEKEIKIIKKYVENKGYKIIPLNKILE